MVASILILLALHWPLANANMDPFESPTLIDLKICEATLKTAKRQLARGENEPAVAVTKVISLAPKPPALFHKMGAKDLGDGRLLLPRAFAINRALNLVEGRSPVYFVEISVTDANRFVDSRGDLSVPIYHYLMAAGYIAITRPDPNERSLESFRHDVYDHVEGYVRLSESPQWKIAQEIMRQAIYIETHYKQIWIRQSAARFRIEIAEIMHLRGGQMNSAAQLGKDFTEIYSNFAYDIGNAQARWITYKSQLSVSSGDDQSWWQNLTLKMRRIFLPE